MSPAPRQADPWPQRLVPLDEHVPLRARTPNDVLADLPRVFPAEAGYQLRTTSPGEVLVSYTRRPTWALAAAVVLAIPTLGLGLLLLVARATHRCVLRFVHEPTITDPGQAVVHVVGELPADRWEMVQVVAGAVAHPVEGFAGDPNDWLEPAEGQQSLTGILGFSGGRGDFPAPRRSAPAPESPPVGFPDPGFPDPRFPGPGVPGPGVPGPGVPGPGVPGPGQYEAPRGYQGPQPPADPFPARRSPEPEPYDAPRGYPADDAPRGYPAEPQAPPPVGREPGALPPYAERPSGPPVADFAGLLAPEPTEQPTPRHGRSPEPEPAPQPDFDSLFRRPEPQPPVDAEAPISRAPFAVPGAAPAASPPASPVPDDPLHELPTRRSHRNEPEPYEPEPYEPEPYESRGYDQRAYDERAYDERARPGPAPEPQAEERTVLRSDALGAALPPAPAGDAMLEFDTGERVPVPAYGLLGRNPSPSYDDADVTLLPIEDPGRSVSKTHLAIGVAADGIWVVDRHSTNGVELTYRGDKRKLKPGERVLVARGTLIKFGDRKLYLR